MKKLFTTISLAVVGLLGSISVRADVGDSFLYNGMDYTILSETDKTVSLTKGKNEENLIIPSEVTFKDVTYTVTEIGFQAFYNCTSLISIEIPNSVTLIGDYVFSNCTSLTSIEIPDSVTSIGNGSFEYCDRLNSIEIPNSVTHIWDGAFANCI